MSNSGFDRLKLDAYPVHWDVFIMPDNEAVGRADTIMQHGDYSVLLYTPIPYFKDPINNWSQALYDNLVEMPLRLTGSIPTEKVGEATLWIECLNKSTRRILATATSADDIKLVGTQVWTQVSAVITPPPKTDFIMVRCVIKGAGKAWFDTLSLSVVEPEAIEAPIEVVESSAIPSAATTAENEVLLNATRVMQSIIEQLEKFNQALLNELSNVRKDLDQYRKELDAAKSTQEPLRGLQPLIPADYIPLEEPRDE